MSALLIAVRRCLFYVAADAYEKLAQVFDKPLPVERLAYLRRQWYGGNIVKRLVCNDVVAALLIGFEELFAVFIQVNVDLQLV